MSLGGFAFSIMNINTGRKSSALATEPAPFPLALLDNFKASNILRLQSTMQESLSFGDRFVSSSIISSKNNALKMDYLDKAYRKVLVD